MGTYLVFQLYGPMQSWGEVAVGEIRPGFGHPTHSGLVGLVAACLGIRRDEEDELARLSDACRFAVAVDSPGQILREYQTVQMPPRQKNVEYRTRRQELVTGVAREKLNTMQTYRDHAQDAVFRVCLSLAGEAPYSLDRIATALERPVFVPYLGRKANPFALPMSPRPVEADSVADALARVRFDRSFEGFPPTSKRVRLAWPDHVEPGTDAQEHGRRRDVPTSRAAWQFGNRTEHRGIFEPGGTKE